MFSGIKHESLLTNYIREMSQKRILPQSALFYLYSLALVSETLWCSGFIIGRKGKKRKEKEKKGKKRKEKKRKTLTNAACVQGKGFILDYMSL